MKYILLIIIVTIFISGCCKTIQLTESYTYTTHDIEIFNKYVYQLAIGDITPEQYNSYLLDRRMIAKMRVH